MSLIVKKFGGSSVSSPEKILNVVKRVIADKKAEDKIVIVVSAMGKTTDRLISLASAISGCPYQYKREMDMLLASGEQVSIALLAMAFQNYGVPAISLTGRLAGIRTDDKHTKGTIVSIDTKRILSELAQNKIVVVAGFQGSDNQDEPVTLGRGGSDTSAVALAGALKADCCEIYTDVKGIYTADPHLVVNATKMSDITYEEMLEMSRLGACVMQTRSVEVGQKLGIPIHVRSTFVDDEGTVIQTDSQRQEGLIRGVSYLDKITQIAICNEDIEGLYQELRENLIALDIEYDFFRHAHVYDNNKIGDALILAVEQGDFYAVQPLIRKIMQKYIAVDISIKEGMAKISVISNKINGDKAIYDKFCQALGKANIDMLMMNRHALSISCLLENKDLSRAVQVIHDEFFPARV